MSFLFVLIRILGFFLPKTIAELVLRGAGRLLSRTAYREAVRNHLCNLKMVYRNAEEKNLLKISRKATLNLSHALYEHSIMDRLNSRNYNKYMVGENVHNLLDAYKKGKGVIILSAHIGNYEWGAALMSFLGLPVALLSIEYKTEYIKNMYEHNRNKTGEEVFYVRRSFSDPVRFIKNGGILALACDRAFGASSFKVKMFGEYIELPKGAFFLASRLKVPVIPAFAPKERDGKYHVYFEEPLEISRGKMEEGAKRFVNILEGYIKKYSEQWLVFEKIWK